MFQQTAAANNITATPSFLFFRNKVKIDQLHGADANGLEEKIKQHLENDPGIEDLDIPRGYVCTIYNAVKRRHFKGRFTLI